MGHYDDAYEYDAKEFQKGEVKELKEEIKKNLKKVKDVDELSLINSFIKNIDSIIKVADIFK